MSKLEYPSLNLVYRDIEKKIDLVQVLYIAKEFDKEDEEYVVYRELHTGTVGVIKLSEWNGFVTSDNEETNGRKRFRTLMAKNKIKAVTIKKYLSGRENY